ncbi:TRAP transporter substrate-binding protein [Roseospira visakhapatnamensis]|uniref:Tripartite ATP-independent transporter DctP family solute receptor n=1 Tax=Roseospira visakhapatnamensis TaxID=390880 RepID=A0A7W6WAU0_9PROT|nr:TRAP transporter substrate-binding protein [Roseospira visakhapatnamensis]MBB4267319.1 tripartite ATP-independent transporter DctP family solute receptor [Roseospira visakhapatnamensis]
MTLGAFAPTALVAAALTLTAYGPAFGETTLRFGHVNGSGEIAADLFEEFAERVKDRTDGEVVINVYPGEQLGKETELVQQAKLGAVDITAPSLPAASVVLPSLEIPSTPFLWDDWHQARAVIEGKAMQPIWDELADQHNLIPLTKTWYWGWRNLTTLSVAVEQPEDMVGLKIRVPESPVWVEMVNAMGAAPTPVPFSDVYTALQQKTVDGQENPIPTIFTRRFYEVQGNLVLTRHMLQNNTILINKKKFESLEPRHQTILMEEAHAASARNTLLQQAREQSMLEQMRDSGGITVIDSPDRAAFRKKTAIVMDNLRDRWGAENIQRIRDEIERLNQAM